jgi:hypothetical protein
VEGKDRTLTGRRSGNNEGGEEEMGLSSSKQTKATGLRMNPNFQNSKITNKTLSFLPFYLFILCAFLDHRAGSLPLCFLGLDR